MKNRKRVIVAFMLIAVMLLGVGYAAVTDNFVITGNATITESGANDAYNSDVRFEGVVVSGSGDSANIQSDVLVSDALGYTASCNVPMDTASFHVNDLKAMGDTKTVTFRVRNYGEIASKINVEAEPVAFMSGTNENGVAFSSTAFKVETNLVDDTDLAAGGYVDVSVTITVNEPVVDDVACQFTVSFTASNEA